MKKDKAVVVFSGGQDSTTCLFWARERFAEVTAVTFDYNQRHITEIDCAKAITAGSLRPSYPEGIYYFSPSLAY